MDANDSQVKASPQGAVEPMVRHEAGAITFSWPSQALDLEFRRLVSSRGGDVSGEVRVGRLVEGSLEVLHESRLNLTSAGARDALARLLGSITGRSDLLRYLDAACTKVLELSRIGEPAIVLRDAPPAPLVEYAVEPLVLARHATIWFGDGGTGKSVLALAAASAIHTGSSFAGSPAQQPRRVLYLDWELDAPSQRARLGALHGEKMPDLVYARCVRSLADEAERISQIIRTHDIEFVIIDSIAAACGGEPEAASTATAFATVLAEVCPGALCLAHTTKDGANLKPFGSTFWHNMVRSTWHVSRASSGPGRLDVQLHGRKASFSGTIPPVGIGLSFDRGRIFLERTEVTEEAPKPSVIERLRALDWGGTKTHAELGALLGEKEDTVRKALDRNSEGFLLTKRSGAIHVARTAGLRAAS